jgi:hypothetical protein
MNFYLISFGLFGDLIDFTLSDSPFPEDPTFAAARNH